MMKIFPAVLVIAFAGINPVLAQTAPLEVTWNGYRLQGRNFDRVNNNTLRFNSVFYEALRNLDKENGYLRITLGFNSIGIQDDTLFKLSGVIEINGVRYTVITELFHENKRVPNPGFTEAAEDTIDDIIREHAENVYNYFISYVHIQNENDMVQTLDDFAWGYGRKIDSLNNEQSFQALRHLAMMEEKFGQNGRIDVWRNRLENNIIDNDLSRAERYIYNATNDGLSDSMAKDYYKSAEKLIAQTKIKIETSGNAQIRARVEEVERKLRVCKRILRSAVYTGGLSFFVEKPLLISLEPAVNLMELYPDILGLSLRYVTPQMEYFRWYVQFSYAGINGGIKETPSVYITDASLQFFSSTLGWHLQFFPSKLFAPYACFGIGYTHFIEYAADGADSVFLHFSNFHGELGVGTRVYIGSRFALNARVYGDFVAGESIMITVHLSAGFSILFHDREYLRK